MRTPAKPHLPCNPLKNNECVSRMAKLSNKTRVLPSFCAWPIASTPIKANKMLNLLQAIFRVTACLCLCMCDGSVYLLFGVVTTKLRQMLHSDRCRWSREVKCSTNTEGGARIGNKKFYEVCYFERESNRLPS